MLAPSLVNDKTDEITDTFIIVFMAKLFKKKQKLRLTIKKRGITIRKEIAERRNHDDKDQGNFF